MDLIAAAGIKILLPLQGWNFVALRYDEILTLLRARPLRRPFACATARMKLSIHRGLRGDFRDFDTPYCGAKFYRRASRLDFVTVAIIKILPPRKRNLSLI